VTRTTRLITFALGVVVLACAMAFLSLRTLSRARAAAAPNVVLLTLTAVRADALGAAAGRANSASADSVRGETHTPNIDRLAQEGLWFSHAYTPAPLTLPAHAAMMTGLYPFYTGVRDDFRAALSPQATTLAELLQRQGYQTCAATAAPTLSARSGLDQGFDHYRDATVRVPIASAPADAAAVRVRSGEMVVSDALEWLKTIDGRRPFFLWCQLNDAEQEAGAQAGDPTLEPALAPPAASPPSTLPGAPPSEQPALADASAGRAAYSRRLAQLDRVLGRLLDELRAQPPNPCPTLVVLTADCGHALGEHGEPTHGYFVYDATLHVPLIVRLPDGSHAGEVVDAPVSTVDVLATVLDLAGLSAPSAKSVHGRSLHSLIKRNRYAEEDSRRRPIYFETLLPLYRCGWSPLKGVRIDDRKYIDAPLPELYLLGQDTREGPQYNAFERQRSTAAPLADALDTLLAAKLRQARLTGRNQDAVPVTPGEPGALDDSAAPLANVDDVYTDAHAAKHWQPRDDPKNRLPLYCALQAARRQLAAGDARTAAAALLDVLRGDADNPYALWLLSVALTADPLQAAESLGTLEPAARDAQVAPAVRASLLIACGRIHLLKLDSARARRCFADALALEPDNPAYLAWLGLAELRMGLLAESLQSTQKASELSSDNDALLAQLGLVQLCNGKIGEAAFTWDKLLDRPAAPLSPWVLADLCARDPSVAQHIVTPLTKAFPDARLSHKSRAAIHATLGQLMFQGRHFDEALVAFQKASELLPREATPLWWQSRVLAAAGRAREAQEQLEGAYRLDPQHALVVIDLAHTRLAAGDAASAITILSTYCDAHPADPVAANNLALFLVEHGGQPGDLDRALQLAEAAVEHSGRSPAATATLGWVKLKRGDGAGAVAAFERAVRGAPDNADYVYHLGLAYRLSGQAEKATRTFARAIQMVGDSRPRWYADAAAAAGVNSPTAGAPPGGP